MQLLNPLTIFRGDRRYLKYQVDVACLTSDSVGDFVCIRGDRTTNKYRVQKADCLDLSRMPAIGVLVSKSTPTVGKVQIYGALPNIFSALSIGSVYYLGTNGISTTLTPPGAAGYSVRQVLGMAIASDVLLVNPDFSLTVRKR